MNRRDAVKQVALIMGGSVVGAQAFLSGCQPKNEPVNSLFYEQDVQLLDEIGETIIPATDTPGAKAADIGNFMAMMVLDCYEEKDQKAFVDGLANMKEAFKEKHDQQFMKASQEERLEFLSGLDKEQKEYTLAHQKDKEAPAHYFRMMKELTLLGYFTSEPGATQALRYIETPGRYDGCVPYKKGDKAWAV